MQLKWTGVGSMAIVLLAAAAFSRQAEQAKPANTSKSVKAETVTINMPEGMTREQADAILNELRDITQLLQNQQNAQPKVAVAAPAAAPTDKVEMSVGQGWYAMGREDAPVTVVEFTDYQCPFCRKFERDSLADLKKNYIDTGKVRFVSRGLPWSSTLTQRLSPRPCAAPERNTNSGRCMTPSCWMQLPISVQIPF